MHDIDYYRQRFILEAGLTRSILEQLRPAYLDYRPHPKSPTAGELFWTIIRGLQIRLDIVRTNEANGPSVASYPSSDDMLASYVDLSKRLGTELATVNESRWEGKTEFRMNGRIALDWPVRDILWIVDRSTSTRFITAGN